MKEDDNILNQFKLRAKPSVPNQYFDNFYRQLMERIELESGVLSQLKKREKPALPADYFEQFSASIGASSSELENFKKNAKPKVEEGFFESFPDKILAKIEREEKVAAPTKIISLKWVTVLVSAAAALLIFFTIMDVSGITNEDGQEVANQFTEEDATNMYLSYLDEDELIEFIIEEDLSTDEEAIELEDYYDYSEEEIEDLYFEY